MRVQQGPTAPPPCQPVMHAQQVNELSPKYPKFPQNVPKTINILFIPGRFCPEGTGSPTICGDGKFSRSHTHKLTLIAIMTYTQCSAVSKYPDIMDRDPLVIHECLSGINAQDFEHVFDQISGLLCR